MQWHILYSYTLSLYKTDLMIIKLLLLRMFLYFYVAIKILLFQIFIIHRNIKCILIIGLSSLGHLWNVFMWFLATLYGHFIHDLCSIHDYSSICILRTTELFLIEYVLCNAFIFQTIIIFIYMSHRNYYMFNCFNHVIFEANKNYYYYMQLLIYVCIDLLNLLFLIFWLSSFY